MNKTLKLIFVETSSSTFEIQEAPLARRSLRPVQASSDTIRIIKTESTVEPPAWSREEA
jgi:hypothetical protein